MKKLLCTMLVAGGVACHSAPPNTRIGGNVSPGAPTPGVAVKQFFDAVHAGDLQAMSLVWGTERGPTRETIPPAELEKREVILQCYFNADSYGIDEGVNGANGRKVFHVNVVRGKATRTTTVNTVSGPGGRWYVESLDIAAVRDFCGKASETGR